jgi:hypothetical protein
VEGDEEQPRSIDERQWLIQCKREKAIGPKKIEGYLDGLPDAKDGGIYGLIFAAACDFSFETRGRFYDRARERGFEEVKLWGKAEIEDQLFQPKNDHLLFAYFGISLQARRRSVKTQVRARLAMKRKAKRLLQPHTSVLVRDASDDRYPQLDQTDQPRHLRGRWSVWRFHKCGTFGVELEWRRHFAFIHDDGVQWDYAERTNDAIPHDDPWSDGERDSDHVVRSEDMRQWDEFPENNKGWLEVMHVLPYDSIIDIDEDGDDYLQGAHIYVAPFTSDENGPFAKFNMVDLSTNGNWGRRCEPDPEKRIKVFPRKGEKSEFEIANKVVGTVDGPEAGN